MKNYIWAWRDDNGIYLNISETLHEIIEDVLCYYSNEDAQVSIDRHGENLLVSISCDEFESDSIIKFDAFSVGKFLDRLASKFDREDHFEIIEDHS